MTSCQLGLLWFLLLLLLAVPLTHSVCSEQHVAGMWSSTAGIYSIPSPTNNDAATCHSHHISLSLLPTAFFLCLSPCLGLRLSPPRNIGIIVSWPVRGRQADQGVLRMDP